MVLVVPTGEPVQISNIDGLRQGNCLLVRETYRKLYNRWLTILFCCLY